MAKRVRFLLITLFFVSMNVVSITSLQAKEKEYNGDVREELEKLSRLGEPPARYTLDVADSNF
ncbi:hypothetical protein FACS189421_13240 [Bacteroidia bacterium]|nr:hypothetical protein FACS189421_13240 [Bacteroidia bacterium]GHT46003.1 hypothetical protein FACS189440_03090 [Bacteroidia bacterium]